MAINCRVLTIAGGAQNVGIYIAFNLVITGVKIILAKSATLILFGPY